MISRKEFGFAIGSLLKSRRYALTVVVTLGLSLGVLVAMFNVNYQLLASPLPYPDQERLYVAVPTLFKDNQMAFDGIASYPALEMIYKTNDEFTEKKAIVRYGIDVIRNLPDTPQVHLGYVTPEFLSLIAPPIRMGRLLLPEEGLGAHLPVAVLSYALWKNIFHQDQQIIGRVIEFGNDSFKVVGVMDEQFIEPQLNGLGNKTDIWLPLDYGVLADDVRTHWGHFTSGQQLVGKIKAGQDLSVVEQALNRAVEFKMQAWATSVQASNSFSLRFKMQSYQQAILGDVKYRLYLLFAGALLLLFIAVVNIANLLLARVAHQQRTMAIRAALGAHPKHLFLSVLIEVGLLIGLAMLLALWVSVGVVELLKHFATDYIPRIYELHLNGISLLFALVTGIVLALVLAGVASKQIDYSALNRLLQSSGKGVGVQVSRSTRRLLVISQVTFTTLILIALLSFFSKAIKNIVNPFGFSESNISVLSLNINQTNLYPLNQQSVGALLEIRSLLTNNPRIESVSLASGIPQMDGLVEFLSPSAGDKNDTRMDAALIDERYLEILQTNLIEGRYFTADEFNTRSPVVIVNEAVASKLNLQGNLHEKSFFWPNGGQAGITVKVIGIIRDLSLPHREELPRIYIPSIAPYNQTQVIIKWKTQEQLSATEINNLLAQVDARYKVAELISFSELHSQLLKQDILIAWISGFIALVSLSLASIGVFGIFSYGVQLQRFELGVRMALGARPKTIVLQLLKSSAVSSLLGFLCAGVLVSVVCFVFRSNQWLFNVSFWQVVLPLLFMIVLISLITLLSVWQVVRAPVSESLKGI